MPRLYSRDAYSDFGNLPPSYTRHLHSFAKLIIHTHGRSAETIDVGAGLGGCAALLVSLGLSVTALDNSPDSMSMATGATTVYTRFEDFHPSFQSAALHAKDFVLEHIPSGNFFEKVDRVIAPLGFIMITILSSLYGPGFKQDMFVAQFKLISQALWNPTASERATDWYGGDQVMRTVLIYQKKP